MASRIKLKDTLPSAVAKMSDGNPGAMTTMMEMMTKAQVIDPQNAMGGMHYILLLDTFGIYGTDIYVLWSDICDKSMVKTLAVLTAAQRGKFDQALLKEACSRQDYSGRDIVPVDDLLEEVMKLIPTFNKVSNVATS